jgi:ketosteroid isomerase-like protein
MFSDTRVFFCRVMTMKNILSWHLFLLSVLAVSGQTIPIVERQPSVSLQPELARVLKDYESFWKNGDSAALARLFTNGGIVLSPGHPMIRGRAAIERFYCGPGSPLFLRAIAFSTDGNLGYIIGGFSQSPVGPDTGKFTLTLQRDASGRWLIVSDMDNGN